MRVFEESQKFTQTWILVILLISTILPIMAIVKEWNLKVDKSIQANLGAVLGIGVVILVISLIFLFKLKTRIDETGITYQFFPIHIKPQQIPWNDIEKIYVRKYNPILEYGGWGFKGGIFFKKRGTAFNVSGNIGIQIELKSGKKILFGTQLKEKAEQALRYYKNQHND
ncbi:hypothetical protein [uncultured Lutibacter sp.]|uniref:hypothetical protein n=1 Tax=uncultured Lutibacter sp. TaxID=437739 RepID=UPI002604E661|nr:hypothetical protein [uncultured Lutibacter sp.]